LENRPQGTKLQKASDISGEEFWKSDAVVVWGRQLHQIVPWIP